MRKIIESLTLEQLSNIIPVIEQGLELTKIEYIATKAPDTRCQIADTCVLLSFLYARKLYIDRPSSNIMGDLFD